MSPDRKELLVADAPGMRLDQFLADRLKAFSRAHLRGLIERGCVAVDGAPGRADRRLKGGERIEVLFHEPEWEPAGEFEDWVLFEDPDLLVLDKPAGLLMHPLGTSWLSTPAAALSEAEPNLAGLLQRFRPGLLRSGVERCGLVHRLDRQTSGVLLVAKTPRAQEALHRDFRERRMEKVYRAIVRGVPKDKAARVSAPVGRRPGTRQVTANPLGKSAESAFRVVSACPVAAVVEARPLTGRTHQIRAHLALLGHPVIGDHEFDREKGPTPPRLMLHAQRLTFTHPVSGKRVTFEASLPKDFRAFWALCRKAGRPPGKA